MSKLDYKNIKKADAIPEADAEKVQTPTFYKSSRGDKVRFMTDFVLNKLWEFEKTHHKLKPFQDEQLKDYFAGRKQLTFNMKLALFFALCDLKNMGYLQDIDTTNM
ncbi:MAG: hypothetical protein KBT12_07860 [Bacteroidales bacterium]|nr:hypothetical protein [Candidatus Physcousia equi]